MIRDNAALPGHWADVLLLALPAFSGFLAAARTRLRSLHAIGVRRASPGALLAGVLGSTVLSAAAAVLVWTFLPTASVGVVSAAVIGFLAAVLLRRTGSVWPGLVAHVVCTGLAPAPAVLA